MREKKRDIIYYRHSRAGVAKVVAAEAPKLRLAASVGAAAAAALTVVATVEVGLAMKLPPLPNAVKLKKYLTISFINILI
jgi:hypothetical protein